MKKVLFVATVTRHINAFHIPYLKWFKEQGYEVHVASNGEEEILYCDKHFDLNFARTPIKLQNWKVYKKLKQIIEENQYEIIHCHTPMGGVIARLAAKKARKKYHTKVIYTAHGFHFYQGAPKLNWLIYYPIEKHLAKYTDILITINQEDYEIAKKKIKAKSIYYLPGVGINLEKFRSNISEERKEQLYQELYIKKEDYVILYVAELSKRKNQNMLIQAMCEVAKEDKTVKLLLVGSGNQQEEYKKTIDRLNLNEQIKLLGYRTDVADLMQIANLYVSTSKQEGLPVNIMEAMAGSIPVIATNCRGNRDLIQDGINGYIVKIDDNIELKEKIIDLKNDQEKTNMFKTKALEDCQKLAVSHIVKMMEKIYLESNEEKKSESM